MYKKILPALSFVFLTMAMMPNDATAQNDIQSPGTLTEKLNARQDSLASELKESQQDFFNILKRENGLGLYILNQNTIKVVYEIKPNPKKNNVFDVLYATHTVGLGTRNYQETIKIDKAVWGDRSWGDSQHGYNQNGYESLRAILTGESSQSIEEFIEQHDIQPNDWILIREDFENLGITPADLGIGQPAQTIEDNAPKLH